MFFFFFFLKVFLELLFELIVLPVFRGEGVLFSVVVGFFVLGFGLEIEHCAGDLAGSPDGFIEVELFLRRLCDLVFLSLFLQLLMQFMPCR